MTDDEREMTDQDAAIWLAKRQQEYAARQQERATSGIGVVLEALVGVVILAGLALSVLGGAVWLLVTLFG